MDKNDIDRVVSEVTGNPVENLSPESSIGATKGWDSLAQLEILERLESSSGKKLTVDQSIFAESLADLYEAFGTGD